MPNAAELAERVLAAHHIREVDGKSFSNQCMIHAILTTCVGIVYLEPKDQPPTVRPYIENQSSIDKEEQLEVGSASNSSLDLPIQYNDSPILIDTDSRSSSQSLASNSDAIVAISGIEGIQYCLNMAPVPCLGASFQLFRSIWDVVQLVGSYKFQLRELAKSIALLLSTLNDQYQRQEPLEAASWFSLSNLERCGHLILAKLTLTLTAFRCM